MANNQRFSITFDASLNVSQMKGALGDIQKSLNNLHLPQNATKGLQGTFSKLSEEIQKFEVAAGKEIGSKANFSKIEKSATKIGELFGTLKRQVSELTGKSGKELEKLFPEDITKKITNATNALNTYKEATNAAKQAMANAAKEVDKFNKKLSNEQKKTPVSDAKYKKIVEENKEANEELNRLEQEREALVQKHEALEARLQKQGKNPGKVYKEQEQAIQNLNKAIEEQRDLVKQTAETKAGSATFDQQAKNIANFSAKLEEAKEKLKTAKEILDRLESNGAEGGLTKLRDEIGRLTGLDMSKFETSIKGVEEAIQSLSSDQLEKLRQGFSLVDNAMGNSETEVQTLGKKLQELGNEVTSADSKMREVDALKSRIQYFFGLNNAIELVKRTIRSAFETVKELDKAMTETAVVTDFSVADMWAQLPDYTKRANDLGVTTKAAYEAATLYYQQGLKTNEVTAMSNETLKMARIAGLDAAVATDRMTNAIRGFNMEINEMNAQRIDDVYSKLAAISASNVDEISTAMTKVASLANNANMEFETTSAFLAQIIETTRESAETAGTALKTVVARFSEVKKLVSEDQLKGQDEEGQLIDVNKVSQALRTAGVDLNKYFLGEVGLDDIFMELASKWDSLTTLQQRYIATQAAGSRQQSRFIALMSDYGRMQELVGEAYNANGTAAEQFAKTQESLESKLARLKNAWNEFAMGIANSDLVKAGVDILTNLLNFVNKLTDGFGLLTGSVGGFISSILKLSLLIGGLSVGKKLISGGIGGIGSLLKGEAFSGGFGDAIGATKGNILKTIFSSFGQGISGTGSILGKAGKGLFTNIGNFGFKLGAGKGLIGKIAGGISAKGLNLATALGFGGDAAASIGGFAAALGTIAPIAIGAALAVKKLYDLSPQGQVKIAEKYANTIKKVSEEAKKTQESLKKAQIKYKEYSQAISSSQSVQDHSKAIQDRNEYLTSLLEQDASFAEYIQSEVKNGEFILSINEEAFANAIIKAEEATQQLKISDLLGQANLAAQKSDLAASKKWSADQVYASVNAAGERVVLQESSESKRFASEKQAYDLQSQDFAKQAAIEMLKDVNLGDELTDIIAMSYAKSFNADKMQQEVDTNWFSALFTSGENTRKYEALYGIGSAKGVSLRDRELAVEASEYAEKQQAMIDELVSYLSGENSSSYEHVLKTLAGDFSDYSSLIRNVISFDPFAQKGIGSQTIELDLDDKAVENIATVYGIDPKELRKQIRTSANIERERQLQVRDTGYYSLAKGGASELDIARYLTLDNFDDMELVSEFAQKFEKAGIGGEITSSILDSIEAGTFENSALQKWIQNLNFDNPIAGIRTLHEGLQSVNPQIRALAESIQANDDAMAQFGASAQLSYLMTSESSEQLSKSLADFIEENGEISSTNIKELAASNADLNTLLETGAFNAKGLAVALNGISTGAFNFYDLNDAIIAAFNSMDDLDGTVSSIIEELNSFDPGYDENDITGFISQVYENATENFNKGAYGNGPMANYMQEIFGAFTPTEGQDYGQSYITWLQDNISWLEANKENMYSAWADVAASWQNGQQGLADIIDTGSEIVIELNGQNTQELIQSLKENTNLTETQIRMMIADYKNYSANFAHELAVNDASKAIDTFMAENRKHVGDQALYTKQELETLAEGLGLSLEEVRKQILEKSGGAKAKKVKIIDVDVKDINSVKKALDGITDQIGNYANNGIVNATNLKKGLGLLGIEEDFDQILNQMVGSAKEFEWDFGGDIGLQKVAIEEGQTAGEALAAAMETAAQQQFGANFFAGVVEAAANNNIDIEPIDIPINVDIAELRSELSVATSQLNTIETRKPNVKVGVDSSINTTISKLQQILNLLNQVNNTKTSPTVNKPNAGGKAPLRGGLARTGGIVKSSASGNHILHPGISLTGEEGPEVVWNKEQGYAYITGNKGPEYQNLQPGDRVFNAQETKKILKRSKKNDAFPSFASGKYPSYAASAYGDATKFGVGSSSKTSAKTSSNSEKTSDEWKNELDWLYNLMEDIAESERAQEKLAKQHERYLKDSSKTGKDLYNITKQQMQNLNQQYAYQKQALAGREKEMQEQINQSGYTDYVWWNNNDRTIEINWDKIESIQDKDTYDKVSELVNKAEDIQSKIDAAEDALLDIEDQMKELQERYVQEYVDFEKRVLEAVVNKYQEQIDNLSELNDILNDSNTNILNSIREEVDLQRQIRDNTDTENQIKDMEARLAYLRRDTTGANQTEIFQLEKQLEDARQDYSDTLVDQSIDRLSKDNEAAAEQREHQIELLTAQLDYWQKSGALWEEVHNLMKEGISPEGWIRFDSDLMAYLKNTEEFRSMSQAQQEQWIKELENVIAEVNAYTLNKEHPLWDNSTDYMAIMQSLLSQRGKQALEEPAYKEAAAARVEKRIAQGATREQALQEQREIEQKYLGGGTGTNNTVSWNKNTDYMAIMQKLLKEKGINALFDTAYQNAAASRIEKYVALGMGTRAQALQEQKNLEWSSIDFMAVMEQRLSSLGGKALTDPIYMRAAQERINKYVALGMGSAAQAAAEQQALEEKYLKKKGYATGGLARKTGLAWLDGTTNEPEYVLNARQTEAFLRLSEVLPSIFGNTNGSTITNGNVYLELTMNVGEIGSDYDVDRLVERVKQDIYETSAYRNINVISSTR